MGCNCMLSSVQIIKKTPRDMFLMQFTQYDLNHIQELLLNLSYIFS